MEYRLSNVARHHPVPHRRWFIVSHTADILHRRLMERSRFPDLRHATRRLVPRAHMLSRWCATLVVTVLLGVQLVGPGTRAQPAPLHVPSPREVLGFEPGDDYQLAD